MKLLYYRMPKGNFGDDLNEWFWDRLLPDRLDGAEPDTLIGIGTLLQEKLTKKLPPAGRKFVLGAGAGYGPISAIDETWNILGVRGPLTASYLDLPPDRVCGDPAIMIGTFEDLVHSGPRQGIGFMPHVESLEEWDWPVTCEKLGLTYIDPTANSKETINRISSLDKLVTEAMHGAIVADSMRVPWVSVSLSDRFSPAKWSDWSGSLGLEVRFWKVPQLIRSNGPKANIISLAQGVAYRAGRKINLFLRPPSTSREIVFAEWTLRKVITDAPAQLSADDKLKKLQSRFQEGLARLEESLAA